MNEVDNATVSSLAISAKQAHPSDPVRVVQLVTTKATC